MADPFVAEIRIFGFNFAPRGWALCDGQLLAISQNTALFSLLGTYYGGDGQITFALPNLQGNLPMHPRQGIGLSDHSLGEMSGSETVTLLQTQIPAHTHAFMASNSDSISQGPAGQLMAGGVGGVSMYAVPGAVVQLAATTLPPAGGSQPHNNLMPYLVLNFCIALQGVYPPR
jgi:microcystin-dependent protein